MHTRTQTKSVLVIGLGALGCPAAQLLAESGVAHLTLLDPDRVEPSNLHRQMLFSDADLGRPKAVVAREHLAAMGPTTVKAYVEALDAENAHAIMSRHDFVIDATDSPSIKFLINDTAVDLGIPFSYGGATRTAGQALSVIPRKSACLRCVFPQEDAFETPGACSELGILGPVGGVIGALQARHALISPASPTAGTLFVYELRGNRWQRIAFERRSACRACGVARRTLEARRPQPCLS